VLEFLRKRMVIEITKFKIFFTQMSLHFQEEKNISVYIIEKILALNFSFFISTNYQQDIKY